MTENPQRKDSVSTGLNEPGVHSETCNYVNSKIAQRTLAGVGEDAFAIRPIAMGEVLAVYGGGFFHESFSELIPLEGRDYYYQIADGIWYGFSTNVQLGIAERINHSCQPNCGFQGFCKVVALRPIESDESITIDYASMQSDDFDGSAFECHCGSPDCRGKVLPDDWKQILLTDPKIAFLQPFIQVKQNRWASDLAVLFSRLSFPAGWQSPSEGEAPTSLLVSESVRWEEMNQPTAARTIAEGEVVFLSGGRVLSQARLASLPIDQWSLYRPLEPGFWIGCRGASEPRDWRSLADREDCNLAFRLGLAIVASRTILEGEPLRLLDPRIRQITDA